MANNPVKVKLSQIRTDADMWARAAIDKDAVEAYADVYRNEFGRSQMPPVELFKEGDVYWIGDGKHRCLGAITAELKEIWANVRDGNERDANVYSAECNRTHGVRRSYKDAEKLIRCLFADDEWSGKSILAISKKCGLSHHFVDKVRKMVNAEAGTDVTGTLNGTVTGADGKQYPAHRKAAEPEQAASVDSSNPSPAEQVPAREPEAATPSFTISKPTDALGNEVPAEFADIFVAAPEFGRLEAQFASIHGELTALIEKPAGSFLKLDAKDIEIGIKAMKAMLRDRRPHAVCPYCHGKKEIGVNVCKACKGRGWCTKPIYDQPREIAS